MEVTLKNSNNKNFLYIFMAVSVLLHIFAALPNLDLSSSSVLSNQAAMPHKIKIRLANTSNKKTKQIVNTETSKNKTVVNPRFNSETNNSFDRETRSAKTGIFKLAAEGARNVRAKKDEQIIKKVKKKKVKTLIFSDFGVSATEEVVFEKNQKVAVNNSRKRGLANGHKTGEGLGQTSDYLEDIPLGDFTRLNSQEYQYYGFYNRIRIKLEQYWGNNIQETAQKISKQGRSIASDANLITGLTISLNSRGEIVDIEVQSPSGVKELDDAAIESFNKAGPFPNPPTGMLKNGRARIEWGFVVNT